MNTPDAYPRIPQKTLPIAKGEDLLINFRRTLNGILTSYDFGVSVRLEIDVDPTTTITATATIDDVNAQCKIESDVADTIKRNRLWRCVVSYPTAPETTEIIPVHGRTDRQLPPSLDC